MKPGLGAELWRSLAGVVARQGDVAATAERELCAAEQSGGVLGSVAVRCWMGEAQGGRGGLKEGRRRSRVHAPDRDPGGIHDR